jgi:hypothetical protein
MPNSRHQWIIGEALIFRSVFNDEHTVGQNGVSAECDIATCFTHIDANARLEPLAIAVDERYKCDGHAEHCRSHASRTVKCGFRLRVQDVMSTQRFKTLRFIGW